MSVELLIHPIFDNKTFDAFEMFHVMGHQGKSFGYGSGTNEEVVVFQGHPYLLKPDLLSAKNIDGNSIGYYSHSLEKSVYYRKICLCSITSICTITQFHHSYVRNIAFPLAIFSQALYYSVFSSHCENADIGVKQKSFHNVISLMWALRAEYMSSRISSVVLSSSHLPTKEEVQSLSACNIDILSNEISSNLSSSLRSFNCGQYRLISGDEVLTTDVSITTTYFTNCKITNNI